MNVNPTKIRLLGISALVSLVNCSSASETIEFHNPIKLTVDGEPILMESNASPAIVDLDNDGNNDLVVGDFSGTMHFYRNEGSNTEPVYLDKRYLMSGKAKAKIPGIW